MVIINSVGYVFSLVLGLSMFTWLNANAPLSFIYHQGYHVSICHATPCDGAMWLDPKMSCWGGGGGGRGRKTIYLEIEC